MNVLRVNLKKNSYPIIIYPTLEKIDKSFFFFFNKKKIMLITNNIISKLWKDKVFSFLKKLNCTIDEIVLKDGEKVKSLKTVENIISIILQKKYGRDSLLIALGGGVIGDLVGFSASIYLRGIEYIQIPTTLLSQVDSSIGGKTGVNHFLGKNMIGSFWQPMSVIINLSFLNTLPFSEIRSGMAEVVKYAIIFDKKFFFWLKKNYSLIIKLKEKYLLHCVKRCCELKSIVISRDEREKNDRMLLNLGHTYGHAIESILGYGFWSHGEAVSVGIIIASYTSFFLGMLKKDELTNIISLLRDIGLPTKLPENINLESYLHYIERDKKSNMGKIRLVLPVSIGKCKVFTDIKTEVILKSIKEVI